MAEEVTKTFGSIRVRGTHEEMEEIRSWATNMELEFDARDLYDRWAHARIWSFDFTIPEHFFMFYLSWQEKICGHRIES
jgi:hypothetical protein